MARRHKLLLASLLAGVMVLHAGAVHARDDDDDDKKGPGVAEEAAGIETENIFGYTLGTDTGEKGEKEITFTLDGRLGKFAGNYTGYAGEAEFEYSITDNLKISLGGAFSGVNINNVPGFDNYAGGGFAGAFFEVKYRFLDHRTAPFGLSLSIEPEWAQRDELTGETATAYGIEFRLAADKELVKDYLFAAVNLVYAPEWEREFEDNVGSWVGSSGLELSGALTAQVAKDLFIGGELRYLAAYEGAGLGNQSGWGLFLGPTVYAQVTKDLYMKAAWSIQLTGGGDGLWNSNLNLNDFERQQLRFQVGYTF